MNADDRLAAGQMFGRYQIVRVLGEGGMGVVYEAIHPALKKRFAIKTLLPSVAELPSVRARFLREGEATARIDHPHIVDVVDVGEHDGMPFLVMEFLEGETVADLLAARGRLEVPEALDVVLPVLSAVAAAHAQGVVHRDLKPSNIFLARTPLGDHVPKVLDFGISKLIGEGQAHALTGTLTVLGTAAYMSPEQTRGAREIDGRSDQYSLGLILYEALTGRRAHDGDHALEVLHNIASGIFKAPRQVRADLPIAIEKILLKMLALDPAARYGSLMDTGRALFPHAGEKARVTLSAAFQRDVKTGEAGAVAGARPTSARPPEPHASTTFREAAAELSAVGGAARPRRGVRAGMMTIAGAAALAAGGWAIMGRMATPTASTPKAAPSTPTAPAPASPPPAAPASPVTGPAAQPPPAFETTTVKPPAHVQVAAPRGATTTAPSRHVHRKKTGRGGTPAPRTESPQRGANDALIID